MTDNRDVAATAQPLAEVDAQAAPPQVVWLVIYKYAGSDAVYAMVANSREQADCYSLYGDVAARRTVMVRVGGLL